jgi:hypothetical protein
MIPTAIAAGISLLIGIVGVRALRRHYDMARRSENWLRAPGTLLRCEIVEQRSSEHNATVYSLDVRYSYQIDGETHESKRIMFYLPEWSTYRSCYADLQDRLLGCERLQVWVNPDNHKQSVLIPGAANAPLGMMHAAAVMMFVCPLAAFIAIYLLFLR